MYFDLVQPARFVIGILKFFGLWRLDNRWEPFYRAYSYLLHITITFLNIATMLASIFTAKDLEQFTESLYMSLTEAGFLSKVVNIIIFNREIVNFIELLQGALVGLRNPDEEKIFEKNHRRFVIVAKFYIYASMGGVVVAFTVVALGSKYVLPYPAWLPFELNSKTFWYAYVFQFIGLTVTCLCNVSIDMLHCYYMHHLSLLYQVIGYRLAHIGVDIREVSNQADVNRKIITELTEIIKIHQFVKRMNTKCEKLTSFPLFMQVLLSALVLCFTGYQLQDISPLEHPLMFLGTADFLIVLGLEIFLPCYYANQATIQSGLLSEALYNSNWIFLPKKSRKLILLYMVFLKDPIYIKAGHYFNFGIPVFAKVVNKAYSFFALLINMKN